MNAEYTFTEPEPTPTPQPQPSPQRPSPAPTTFSCTDCDPVDRRVVWIAHTDGDGIAVRDDCLDSARVGRFAFEEGSSLSLLATGSGRCVDWSVVGGGDANTWVRNRYLANEEPTVPLRLFVAASLLPDLPIPFCTISPREDQNANFNGTQLQAAAVEAARIWNAALQEAVHDHALPGIAVDYSGACPSADHGAENGRNEIFVATLSGTLTGLARVWPEIVDGALQYETDILIAPDNTPGCALQVVLTHEMGHSLGLGHGGRRGDLMYRRTAPQCLHPKVTEVGTLLDAYAQ